MHRLSAHKVYMDKGFLFNRAIWNASSTMPCLEGFN